MLRPSGKAIKLAAFSLAPALILFLGAEGAVRIFSLDRAGFAAGGWGHIGQDSLVVPDPHLGWTLKPRFDGTLPGPPPFRVATNSLGLRSGEVPEKKDGAYRILSLGESSAFGVGVDGDQTYAAKLEKYLNLSRPPRPVMVINAAVSAYSSFQSVKYLGSRGLRLQPDLVLFYHEINDYLPTTIRDTNLAGLDLLRTDRQMYDSRINRFSQIFLRHSALYRFLTQAYARLRIRRLDLSKISRGDNPNPLAEIGFPKKVVLTGGSPREIGRDGKSRTAEEILPYGLGRRVPDEDRRRNLTELLSLCRRNGAGLVVIHPSYSPSTRHECLLTRFCRDNGVPMFEAYDVFHPGGSTPRSVFLDDIHPSAIGHELLARELVHFLIRRLPEFSYLRIPS
jgi:hypothetical protein